MAVCEIPTAIAVPLPPRRRLVAALAGRKGFPTQRHLQASRLVVDDFGDAVAYDYRCSRCMRWGAAEDRYCRSCKLFANSRRYWSAPEAARERQRAAQAERNAMPGYREREREQRNAARRARMARDPEGERTRERLRTQRNRARRRKDPERYRAELEDARMNSVLRRMALGLPTGSGKGRRMDGTGSRLARDKGVSSVPLAAVVAREAMALHEETLTGERMIADRSGLSPKVLYNFRTGRSARALWDTADRVLAALDCFWWEVFDPEDAKPGLFSGERGRDVVAWTKAGLDAAELWGDV